MARLTITPHASCSPRVARPHARGQRSVVRPAAGSRARTVRVCSLLKAADGVAVTWEQTPDEVLVRVPVAAGIKGRDVNLEVHPKRLRLAVQGKPLLEGSLQGAGDVDISGCFFTMEGEGDGRHVFVTLAKGTMGYASWDALLDTDKPDLTVTDRAFLEFAVDGKPLGRVALALYGNVAPRTVANFVALAAGDRGVGKAGKPLHFKGSPMHRIIPGFMAQGGDFTAGNGTGGESIYGERFEDEPFRLKHDSAGLLAMANAGPNTNGSQFYVTYGPQPHLDGRHVVFGRVEGGMDVMRALEGLGSAGGKPSAEVLISDCGKLGLADSDLDALLDHNKRLAIERAVEKMPDPPAPESGAQ